MFRLSGEWVIESPNIYLKQAVYLNFRLHLHQSAFYLKHAIKALLYFSTYANPHKDGTFSWRTIKLAIDNYVSFSATSLRKGFHF